MSPKVKSVTVGGYTEWHAYETRRTRRQPQTLWPPVIGCAARAFAASCDRRVSTARVQVTLRTARGDVITVG